MRWYILALNPEPWRMGPVSVGRAKGHLYPYVGADQQLAAYKEAIKEEFTFLKPEKLDGDVELVFRFWRNRAEYHSARKRVVKNSPDVTNMQKATEDALQGILFDNDRQVRKIDSELVDSGQDTDGRILIGVAPYVPNEQNWPEHLNILLAQPRNLTPKPYNTYNTWGDGTDAF
jgi:Holliday junction resolvase RusA-like endonuclease